MSTPELNRAEEAPETTTGKAGFLAKLTAFAASLDVDPHELIFREIDALRAETRRLSDELVRLKEG